MSDPIGVWHLVANGFRLTATIEASGGGFTGHLDTGEVLDSFSWDEPSGLLQFRRPSAGGSQWYWATVREGVLVGRFSSGTSLDQPAISAYQYHVTGWSQTAADAASDARVWDLTVNTAHRARLRIDRSGAGWQGRLKFYGSSTGELLEEELTAVSWDGIHLGFTRGGQVYSGTASGRTIAGSFTSGGSSFPWSGVRAEVLTHGLAPMTAAARDAYQTRTRAQLELLAMAGNPAPLSSTVTVIRSGVAPIAVVAYPPDRDDDPTCHSPAYTLTELGFSSTLPNPYGGPAITRSGHGYLAVPNGLQPGEKRPAVLALNGHGGSGWQCMDPNHGIFWYGDGWARRGYVVLAPDVGHRNDSPLYSNEPNGDDPAHGNVAHPSIKAAGFDTDWEEDGERTWDCQRALDYLLSLPYVDPARVIVTGISLGGEMTTYVGALDERVSAVVPAGWSPDLSVLLVLGSHGCWQWVRADIREYIDNSDLLALVAPRPLIVETGKQDTTFSVFSPPFAGDKQVMRRTASAYADVPKRLLHYLHYDFHVYHVGGYSPGKLPAAGFQNGVQVTRVTAPTAPGSTSWQTDPGTQPPQTLFEVVAGFWSGEA